MGGVWCDKARQYAGDLVDQAAENKDAPKRRGSLAGTNLYLDTRTGIYIWRRTDERTGKRFKRSTGTKSLELARKMVHRFEDQHARKVVGLVTYESWRKELLPLVEEWIEEQRNGLASERVVAAKEFRIHRILQEWNLKTAAELDDVTKLNNRLMAMAKSGVRRSLLRFGYQEPLRQFSAWLAANKRHLEYDPLACWKPLKDPERGTRRPRRAFLPDEVARALLAADGLDALRRRARPQRPVYTALLVTAARTGTLLERSVIDFDPQKGRINLGADVGNKHRGFGALDQATAAELVAYIGSRKEGRLFLGPDGRGVHIERLLDQWREAFGLGLVDALWPESEARDFHLAHLVNLALLDGRARANPGGNPKRLRPETIKRRNELERKICHLADTIRDPWQTRMTGVDVYSLRKTHRTWAELQGVPAVLVDKQLGHSNMSMQGASEFMRALLGSNTGRKYYLDTKLELFDAGRSARAVRALLDEALRAVLSGESCLTVGRPAAAVQPCLTASPYLTPVGLWANFHVGQNGGH